MGELDVTSHSDFPLALTFQIEDIQELTSTSGDYSKTFRIPATKRTTKYYNIHILGIELGKPLLLKQNHAGYL